MDRFDITYPELQADEHGRNVYLATVDFGEFSNGKKAIKKVFVKASNGVSANKCLKQTYGNADYLLFKLMK